MKKSSSSSFLLQISGKMLQNGTRLTLFLSLFSAQFAVCRYFGRHSKTILSHHVKSVCNKYKKVLIKSALTHQVSSSAINCRHYVARVWQPDGCRTANLIFNVNLCAFYSAPSISIFTSANFIRTFAYTQHTTMLKLLIT